MRKQSLPLAGLPLPEKVFEVLFAGLVLGFFFLPDKAGRNLVLYLTALSAHALLVRRGALKAAFGHGGGWAVLALVLVPAASLIWSTGAGDDTAQDLLVAAYCVAVIYAGGAVVLTHAPRLAGILAVLVLLAANGAGAVAIVSWTLSDPVAGGFRLAGVWGIDNPVHASVLLLGATLPVLSQVLAGHRAVLWLGAAVVPVCFVVLAGARTAAAAYVLVVVAMALAGRWRASVWIIGGAAAAAAVVAVLAVALLGSGVTSEVWLARGLSYRDEIWQQVWVAYRECNALIGCGIATPLAVDVGGVPGERAHSLYVAALYHQGLLGLVVFVAACSWLLWRGLRPAVPPAHPARGWAWMLAYVLLANVTSGDHVLVRAALFWPCFWIPVMVVAATSRGSWQPGRP